jgi:FkbM family methyltransferase
VIGNTTWPPIELGEIVARGMSLMLNEQVGFVRELDGRRFIETRPGTPGFAIYGPYTPVEPGQYTVEYNILPIDLAELADDDVCAFLDVARDAGRDTIAVRQLTAGALRAGNRSFYIGFDLDRRSGIEYRVFTDGRARLEIDEYCRCVAHPEAETHLGASAFPKIGQGPEFFRSNRSRLRWYYEQGFTVSVGDDLVLEKDGIRFHADCPDDLNLVNEIFLEKVYRIGLPVKTHVIDIGMNLGLVAMQFASNPNVEKVYSFEPFPSTYRRALRNFALNPDLSAKISAANLGLGAATGAQEIRIKDTEDSGARSTLGADGDVSIQLQMIRADEAVARIIDEAAGAPVIAKIDCEGSEYLIFEQLEAAGLLPKLTAFMVEWHPISAEKHQGLLTEPLRKAGFVVFDRSPVVGGNQGMFYAARVLS